MSADAAGEALAQALRAEEDAERRLDAEYWQPRRRQIERLRRDRPRGA